jgi:hypothetical protein
VSVVAVGFLLPDSLLLDFHRIANPHLETNSDHSGANLSMEVFYSSMQTMPYEIPVSPSVTHGFMIVVLFFLGLLVFEVLVGEAVGVPAKRREQPMKYWIVLAGQAGTGILFAAVLYFFTH